LVAASLKITALLSVFAIIGVFILEWFGVNIGNNKKKIFPKNLVYLFSTLLVIAVPVAWVFYANSYNQAHDTTYFSTTIFPIWDLNAKDISGVLKNIQNLWAAHYFHISVLICLPVLFGFWVFQYKKGNQIIWWSSLIILVEIIFYIALQFWTFADHDYYTINLYILPVLLVVGVADWVKQNHPNWLDSKLALLVFVLFIGFNIQYTHQKMDERYNSWMNDLELNQPIYSITPILRQMGISATDKVISIPDMSHASLYLMNQSGWTEYTDAHFNSGEKTFYNQDKEGIKSSISKGAKYLIVNGVEQLYTKPYLKKFCTYLLGSYQGVMIFDLVQKEPNFNLTQPVLKTTYFCNADSTLSDDDYFIGTNTKFEGAKTKSSEFAFSGNHSVKINTENPYGMTLKLNDIKEGERFEITFWRKAPENSSSTLVVSSQPNKFYQSNISKINESKDGWIQYQSNFMIPYQIEGQELKIFFYNPDEEPAYFDDLKVTRMESYLK